MSKYNFTFFQDLLREKRGGKYSSKKIWGSTIMLLVSAAFVADGLKFYTVTIALFNSMLIAGSTLIGLRTASAMFNKSTPKESEITRQDEN